MGVPGQEADELAPVRLKESLHGPARRPPAASTSMAAPTGLEALRAGSEVSDRHDTPSVNCSILQLAVPWLSVLSVLSHMLGCIEELQDIWDIKFDTERIVNVACAVERFESRRLYTRTSKTGLAAPGQGRRVLVASGDAKARRGRDGVAGEWLANLLSDVTSDGLLDVGDSVRLLERIVVERGGLAKFDASCWLTLREILDAPADDLTAHDVPHSCAASSSRGQLSSAALELAHYNVAVAELLRHANREGDTADTVAGVVASIALELLVQQVAFRAGESVSVGADALIGRLLWRYCGWDTPIGRQWLRKLARTFDQYANDGSLTKSSFLRLCDDAGLASSSRQSEHHSGQGRLAHLFMEAVDESRGNGSFLDFIYTIELVAYEAVQHCSEPLVASCLFWPKMVELLKAVFAVSVEPRQSMAIAHNRPSGRGRFVPNATPRSKFVEQIKT